jgi:glutathione synthase
MKKKINKRLKALFQMDPFENLNKKNDSTICIINEAIKKNFEIWFCSPKNISVLGNKVFAKVQRIKNDLSLESPTIVTIDKFDFFFIRQDPPFDLNYLTNCYLLELHKNYNQKPYFVNCPSGIKNFTEKIFPLYFLNLMPKTCITSNEKTFIKILSELKIVVIKTLFNKGGEGVFKVSDLNKNDSLKHFKLLLKKYRVPVVVQKFIPLVSKGDKRVILIDGEPKGVVNRIPAKGSFKANLHLGGQAKQTSLTKKEKKICQVLKPILKKEGLFFVGIDLINEKLTEINVTSPTGIVQINDIAGINIAKMLWEKLIKKTL